MEPTFLKVFEDLSCDLNRLSIQKRLNSWLMKEIPCSISAFNMVVDNYGQFAVEVIGNQELRCRQYMGSESSWAKVFKSTDHVWLQEVPEEMRSCIEGVFNRTEAESEPIFLHVLRGTTTDKILGVLLICRTDTGKQLNTQLPSRLQSCMRTVASVMRMSMALEKQAVSINLKNSILAMLHNSYVNVEEMVNLVQNICSGVKALIPSEECFFYLIDVENAEVVAELVERSRKDNEYLRELHLPIRDDIVGSVAKSGKIINWNNDSVVAKEKYLCNSVATSNGGQHKSASSNEVVLRRMDCSAYKNSLCFPIKQDGAVVAVIQLLNKVGTPTYAPYDEEVASMLSSYCAISISHCLLFKKMQETSRRTHLASASMRFHTQKVVEEDVYRLMLSPIVNVEGLHPDFLSFLFSPRIMSLNDSQMACLFMFYELGFMSKFRIKRQKMVRFLLTVEKGYRDVPYHNWYHAFTVAHFCFLLLKVPGIQRYLSDVDRLSLLVASLCHDIDHRGTNNSFQLQTKTALAQLYSSEGSVLECHHFAQTMCILNMEGCNIFEEIDSQLYQLILDKVRDIILATDLAQHLRIRDEIEAMANGGFDKQNKDHVFLLQSAIMTACDLSDQIKPWQISKTSAAFVYKEFFSQGDLEKAMGNSPAVAMDRDKADILQLQLDFLDTIVIPLYKMLAKMFPELEPVLKSVQHNRLCYDIMAKHLAGKAWKRSAYDSPLLDPDIEKAVLDIVNGRRNNNNNNKEVTKNRKS